MKLRLTSCALLSGIALTLFPAAAHAAVVFTTQKAETGAAPAFPATFTPTSSTDLANTGQSTFSSTTQSGLAAGEVQWLNDGSAGGNADSTQRTSVLNANSFTFNFNVTTNTLGYDIKNINSYAGWNPAASGRSNQGYDITVTFMNNTTQLINVSGTTNGNTFQPNTGPSNTWTAVYISENDTGIIASGVKAITFSNFDAANANGNVLYREFDVIGVATVPEPSGALLLGLGGVCMLIRRRR